MENQEEEETQENKRLKQYLNHLKIEQKQVFNYNRNFENENNLFSTNCDTKQIDQFSDCIQNELEKLDQCDGFELLIDCETGYGDIGIKIVETLNDLQNSKTPKLVMPLWDVITEKNNLINRALTLRYKEDTTILAPLEQKNISIYTHNFDQNQQYSFLINNITSPYRIKEQHVCMSEFCSRIVPFPSCNIFNVISNIPLLNDKPQQNILNYKKFEKYDKYYTSQQIYQLSESFGESYFLRGMSPLPQENIKSYGVDIRILDYIYQIPYDIDDALPYHSCLFSNESYKYNVNNLLNELNQFSKVAYQQYKKYSFEDENELKYELQQLIENYGGVEQ